MSGKMKRAERLLGQIAGFAAPGIERVIVVIRTDKSFSEFSIPTNRYGDLKEVNGEEIVYSPQELSSGLRPLPKLHIGDFILIDLCAMTCNTLKWKRATEKEIALYC